MNTLAIIKELTSMRKTSDITNKWVSYWAKGVEIRKAQKAMLPNIQE